MFALVGEATLVVAFALGMLILCIIAKVITLPIALLVKFATNSMIGAIMLCIVNLFNIGVHITIWKALFCGICGVPGVLLVVIWDKFIAG